MFVIRGSGMLTEIFQAIQFDVYLRNMFILALIIFILTAFYYLYLVLNYRKLSSFMEALENDIVEARIEEINEEIEKKRFSNVIKNLWQRFYTEYNNESNHTIPDPLFYFNENEMINKAGWRKVAEVIPAVFVSLGILGTFIGITTGISDINTNADVEGIQTGINTLLSGMKFAFYSSILGIVISLIYQLVDRSIFYKLLTVSSDKLLVVFDKVIPVETESSLLDKMAKAQEEQLNDMKTFFTDQFLPVLTSGISDSISNTIAPHLEKSNEIMDQVAQNTLEAQSESLNTMVDHFVESLNEVTGNQMKELGAALHKTIEWQEKVHNGMSSLVEELSNVAQEQSEMARNTTELSVQMNEYTEKLSNYQEKLSATTHELDAITRENTQLLNQMGDTFEKITLEQKEEKELFDQRIINMNKSVDKITNLGSTFTELNEEMKLTLETLIDTTGNMNENVKENHHLTQTLMDQHELSNKWSTKTHELLEDVNQNSNQIETIQGSLEKLYKAVVDERTVLENMQSSYSQTITTSVHQLSTLWKEHENTINHSQTQFKELNEQLSHSMDSFAEHMHRGVQETFEQFDVELKKAVEYLERGVSNIGIVVESLEDDMGSVNGQITRFNEYLKRFNSTAENRMITHE